MAKYDRLHKNFQEQRRNIESLEERLERMQWEVHKRYPSDIAEILGIVNEKVPVVYAITPTYARAVQKAELTRLSQTFMHVRKFHWIVVEDAEEKSTLVGRLLLRSGLRYTHLYEPTPSEMKLRTNDPNWYKPRGVAQRNAGLLWLRENVDPEEPQGVVYFADDDNTYDLQLFTEVRSRWRGCLLYQHISGLVQERRNSSALAMELRLSCINPSIYTSGLMQDCDICIAVAMETAQSCIKPSIIQYVQYSIRGMITYRYIYLQILVSRRYGCYSKCVILKHILGPFQWYFLLVN